MNSFLILSFLNQLDLGAAGRFQFPAVAVGNEDLNEESLTAHEAATSADSVAHARAALVSHERHDSVHADRKL